MADSHDTRDTTVPNRFLPPRSLGYKYFCSRLEGRSKTSLLLEKGDRGKVSVEKSTAGSQPP